MQSRPFLHFKDITGPFPKVVAWPCFLFQFETVKQKHKSETRKNRKYLNANGFQSLLIFGVKQNLPNLHLSRYRSYPGSAGVLESSPDFTKIVKIAKLAFAFSKSN
jgi:hypothetical protein